MDNMTITQLQERGKALKANIESIPKAKRHLYPCLFDGCQLNSKVWFEGDCYCLGHAAGIVRKWENDNKTKEQHG